MTRSCWAFRLMYLRLDVCANVNMGALIVGYGIAVYGRLPFTNDTFFSLILVVGAYLLIKACLRRVATRFCVE